MEHQFGQTGEYSVRQLVEMKYALDTSAIVALTDAKGKIVEVNDTFCAISGYSRAELLGFDHRIINSGYHSKSFFGDMWQTILSGKVWKGEICNRAKQGHIYWVKTTIVPLLDEKGKPERFLAVRTDITKEKQMESEMQFLMSQIMRIQEDERKRVSLELHDGIGQNLYSLLIQLDQLQHIQENDSVRQIRDSVAGLIEEVRGIAWELRPTVLDDLGLIPALRSYIKRYQDHYQIQVKMMVSGWVSLTPTIETMIYRIIQEALTNIRKYAGVNEAQLILSGDDIQTCVEIIDHGNGFDPALHPNGVGLASMSERARLVGAQLEVESQPGSGVKISLKILKNQ